jgi:protein SCO1
VTSFRLAIVVAAAITLAGVGTALVPRGSAEVRLTGDVLPPRAAPQFRLTDQFGRSVSLSQFRGRPVILTFMQANCTGLCPLTTETLRRALAEVGPPSTRVAVLAVSADPEGDTRPAVLRFSRQHQLLHRWHYLLGSREQLRPVWHRYYIYVAPPNAPNKLKGGHTSAVYLLDAQGRERVLMLGDPDTAQLVGNLRILLGLSTQGASTDAVPAPEVGHPAPDLSLRTLDGTMLRLQSLHRPVLLNFWATWCTACKSEIPAISNWYRRHHREVLVVGIDEQEPRDSVASYARKYHIPYPIALDSSGTMGARYNVAGLPMSLLVDANGIVQSVHWGALPKSILSHAAHAQPGRSD